MQIKEIILFPEPTNVFYTHMDVYIYLAIFVTFFFSFLHTH